MAKFLEFDRKQVSHLTGLIPLRRGDDWTLNGKIVEKYGAYKGDVDITGVQEVQFGFLPASGSTPIAATVEVIDETCAKIKITLAKADTLLVAEAADGVGAAATIIDSLGAEETVETEDLALEILDRRTPTS